ncbi:MAG: S8 family peptidase [bacterium]
MRQKTKKFTLNFFSANTINRNNLYLIIFFAIFLFVKPVFAIEPNDPGYSFQWYLEKIGASESWDITTGDSNVIIAFIDSGVYIDHPDLKKNIWVNMDEIGGDNIDNDLNGYVDDVHGWNFIDFNNDPNPKVEAKCLNKDGAINEKCNLGINHGTIIAGVAAAIGNNKQGIAGVAWNAKIMPLKVLDGTGNGENKKVIEAVNYAVNNGASIINLSIVGDEYSRDMELALQNAYNHDVIILAAAGNNDGGGINIDKYPKYPACYKGVNGENIVLGIAGTDKDDKLAIFSNYGTNCIDVGAPAVDFYSTSFFNPAYQGLEAYYSGLWSGTSLSTPIVAGLAALMKSSHPLLSNREIYKLIINNADDTGDKYIGAGRINFTNTLLGKVNEKISASYILAVPEKMGISEIRKFRADSIFLSSFTVYEKEFSNGANIAVGDADGDGKKEIFTAKNFGSLPQVKIFNQDGDIKKEFLAYGENFKGGVSIAAGDLNNDGINEIITGTGKGGGPQVRVFDMNGRLKLQFFAYAESFHGGVNVASGDADGDGITDIITAAGKGGRSHIKVYNNKGMVKSQFFAYNRNFFGGVNIACGDLNKDGKDEIITSPLSDGGPHIKVFDADGNLKSEFFAYERNFFGGVNIASGDIDNNGINEIITGQADNNSEIKIFDIAGNKKIGFDGFGKNFRGGVNVGIISN